LKGDKCQYIKTVLKTYKGIMPWPGMNKSRPFMLFYDEIFSLAGIYPPETSGGSSGK